MLIIMGILKQNRSPFGRNIVVDPLRRNVGHNHQSECSRLWNFGFMRNIFSWAICHTMQQSLVMPMLLCFGIQTRSSRKNDAPVHKSRKTIDAIRGCGFESLSNYFLFRILKKYLRGHQFSSDGVLKDVLSQWSKEQDKDFSFSVYGIIGKLQ